jgi:hypothetical protein
MCNPTWEQNGTPPMRWMTSTTLGIPAIGSPVNERSVIESVARGNSQRPTDALVQDAATKTQQLVGKSEIQQFLDLLFSRVEGQGRCQVVRHRHAPLQASSRQPHVCESLNLAPGTSRRMPVQASIRTVGRCSSSTTSRPDIGVTQMTANPIQTTFTTIRHRPRRSKGNGTGRDSLTMLFNIAHATEAKQSQLIATFEHTIHLTKRFR